MDGACIRLDKAAGANPDPRMAPPPSFDSRKNRGFVAHAFDFLAYAIYSLKNMSGNPPNATSMGQLLVLLAVLATCVTYQAGMNPPAPGGFREQSRCQGSNQQYCLAEARAMNERRLRDAGGASVRGSYMAPSHYSTVTSRALQTDFRLHQDVLDSQTLYSCAVAITLLCTLIILFKAIGIPLKANVVGSSRYSEPTPMGSYIETEPENMSGSNSMAAATWLVGSATTHHATGNLALLSDFKTVDDLNIQTGDGRLMPVRGRGSVITDAMVLPDVWFVPDLEKNIVSVSQLAELDYSMVFKRDACYISAAKDGTIIGKALAGEKGMFMLEFLKVPLVK